MDKVVGSVASAVDGIRSGSVLGVAGFGVIHGFPMELINAVAERGLEDLVLVCNSLGIEEGHPVTLVQRGRVRKLVASFSARPGGVAESAESLSTVPLEVELVPQGILVERLRMAGAGMGPFYSPVGVDTLLAQGREVRHFEDRDYVLEYPLPLDVALVYAHAADRMGNLAFRGTSQNFAPSFAKAGRMVIAQVAEVVEVGELAPEEIGLPGIFVDRVVRSEKPRQPMWMAPREDNRRREYAGKPGLTPAEIGARLAALVPDGSYVNLGLGLPTQLSDHIDGRDITLHGENGVLGYGSRLSTEDADPDFYNAGAEPVELLKGASVFDSVEAFEIARGGRLSAVMLGAFEVDQQGSFSSWTHPQLGGGAIGGAMDLLVRPGRLIIAMRHCERSGQPKLVPTCRNPVTGAGCVDFIVTDVATFERDARGLILRDLAPGFTPDDVIQLTEAPFQIELWSK